MRLVTFMLVLLTVPVSALWVQSAADSAAIREAALDYIEGWYTNDAGTAAALGVSEVQEQAELVGPGVISLPDRNEAFPAVDPRDGSLWFSIYDDSFDEQTIMFARRTESGWARPEVAPFSGPWGARATRFSPDGGILYFTSSRPRAPGGPSADMNIWRVERSDGTWGEPEPVPGPVNSEASDIHSSATHRSVWVASRRSGSLGRSDIFRVGGAGPAEHLGAPINANGLNRTCG